MRGVHERLREALQVTRTALDDDADAEQVTRDLLLYCHGFCSALTGHHEGEDRGLFPAIAAAHPELRETLDKLAQDHSMIAHLLSGLQGAIDRSASAAEMDRHLEGIEAIMESHFRFEERSLLNILEHLDLIADPRDVLGPL